jgi:hypothetical protein
MVCALAAVPAAANHRHRSTFETGAQLLRLVVARSKVFLFQLVRRIRDASRVSSTGPFLEVP